MLYFFNDIQQSSFFAIWIQFLALFVRNMRVGRATVSIHPTVTQESSLSLPDDGISSSNEQFELPPSGTRFPRFACTSIVLAISIIVRLNRSATPFCWGAYG